MNRIIIGAFAVIGVAVLVTPAIADSLTDWQAVIDAQQHLQHMLDMDQMQQQLDEANAARALDAIQHREEMDEMRRQHEQDMMNMEEQGVHDRNLMFLDPYGSDRD